MGLYEVNSFRPDKGDLVFLDTDSDGEPDHIGIVESISGDSISTIEGNSADVVARCSHSLAEGAICGYASMKAAMMLAGLIQDEDDSADDQGMEHVLVDQATGVKVVFNARNLPDDVPVEAVGLRVLPIGEEALASYRKVLGANDSARVIAWDISLYNTLTGEEFQPIGGVRVSMPAPEHIEGGVSVYHVDDNMAEHLDATKGEDNTFEFDAEHFSVYAFVMDAAVSSNTVRIKVEWKCAEGTSEQGIRDEQSLHPATFIRYKLYKNGVSVGSYQQVEAGAGWELTNAAWLLEEANGTKNTYTLELYSSAVSYTFAPAYSSVIVFDEETGTFVDTRTFHETASVTATISFANDENDRYGLRPETIDSSECIITHSYTSYLNGSATKMKIGATSVEKNEDGTFTARFDNVPTYYYDSKNKATRYTTTYSLHGDSFKSRDYSVTDGGNTNNMYAFSATYSMERYTAKATYTVKYGTLNSSTYCGNI